MHVRRSSIILAVTNMLLLSPTLPARADDPVVRVAQGRLRGRSDGQVAAFKGIPFAAPPVGQRRWRAPEPPAAWRGTRDAGAVGAACLQLADPPLIPPGMTQSEDCLTLNVWTPTTRPAAALPVMLWIHGGSFTQGSGGAPFFSGERLVSRGVIVVTINYRLGRLGYFAHPALSRADPKGPLGNYAVLDQIAALRWVKRNIAAFGGDARRVTVFGESAGANSVQTLLVTPLARGLFARAISQSGFARGWRLPLQRVARAGEESAETVGAAFARAHGIEGDGPQALRALRALPPAELKNAPTESRFIVPLIDGVVVPNLVLEGIASGEYNDVPVLLGGNSWESFRNEDARRDPGAVLRGTGDPARALALFDPQGKLGPTFAAHDLITDRGVTEPSRRIAELLSERGGRSYLYRFSYLSAPLRAKLHGAPHASEIGYVFGNLPAQAVQTLGMGELPAATPEDRTMSDAMGAYWVAFASGGDPGGAGGPRWPAFDNGKRALMEFAVGGPVVREGLFDERLDWLRTLAEPKAALAPSGAAAR